MKTKEEIKEAINLLNDKLATLDAAIAAKQDEAGTIKQRNRETLARNIGKKKNPASVQVNRASVMQLQLELEDLTSVRATIEEELQRARTEGELVGLFDQVGQYQAAKNAYMEKVKLILEGFFEVEKTLQKINDNVTELKKLPHPIYILRQLLSALQGRGLSYGAFFQGEIKPMGEADNVFISSTRNEYKKPLLTLQTLQLPLIKIANEFSNHLTSDAGAGDILREYKKTTGTIDPIQKFDTVQQHNSTSTTVYPRTQQLLIEHERQKAEARRKAHRGLWESK